MIKRFLIGLVLIGFVVSCEAERNWYYRKERTLSGGRRLAKLKAEHTFKFVVIGDTRTGIKHFRKQIDEINLIDPDFVIDVGDMIPGYANEESKIEAMWDEFDKIVSRFKVPLIMVPGNHDIWNLTSRKIYRKRYGKTYFSFSHKGVHFVVLDSEMPDSEGKTINRISDEQIKWLAKDLSDNANARAKFVFLHKPLWQDRHVAKGASEHWLRKVHPLLVKYGVSAVFAGHIHRYVKCPTIDGVHYYITGGGGAELRCKPEEGGFYHYCLVTVRDKNWKMAVIKSGCIFSDEIVKTPARMLIGTKITSAKISAEKTAVPVVLTLSNLSYNKKIEVSVLADNSSNPHYKVTVLQKEFEIGPRVEYKLRINLVLDDMKYLFPVAKVVVGIKGLGKKEMKMSVPIPVVARKCVCRKFNEKITVDGNPNDVGWKSGQVLSEFWTPQASRKAKFPTEVRIGYDDTNFYLLFVCHEPNMSGIVAQAVKHDGKVWKDDSVEIFLDTNLDRKDYYHIIVNAKGISYDGIGESSSWNGRYDVKTSCGKNKWIAEFAIPWKTIGLASPPKSGTKIGLELTRNRVQNPSELTQWSPTFDGNHVPEQFGELIIK